MTAYENLSASYDGLTRDIDYSRILDFLEAILKREDLRPETVLDLACGTGSMSLLLAQRGYKVLAADISEEMLTVAAQKAARLQENPPYFICQPMQRLSLPQPVNAVFCLLDSINYLTRPEDCRKTLQRVFASLEKGGVFFFDINTGTKLRALDGQVFLDENEESYCVWRADFDEKENLCYYGIDLFQKKGKLWERSFEQHCEYAYETEELLLWLKEAGFARVDCYGDCRMEAPAEAEQRIYFAAFKE